MGEQRTQFNWTREQVGMAIDGVAHLVGPENRNGEEAKLLHQLQDAYRDLRPEGANQKVTGEGNTEAIRARAEREIALRRGNPCAADALYLLAERDTLREQLAATEKQRRIFEELSKLNASERADEAEALAGRLREQLDAARQALVDLHESLFIGSERGLSNETLGSMATFAKDAARAALGVEGPQPDQGSAPTENVGRARDEEPS